MSQEAASPSRISVYLARGAPVGVILRRGPSQWAHLTLWDRRSDRFTAGQWFRGRVYERRCDVSPDGRYFVYFAAKNGPRDDPHGIGEAWTAISRPPYFTALGLWTNLGSWYGGGVFDTDRQLQLDATCSLQPHRAFPVPHLKIRPMAAATSPWEQRLLAAGWRLVERGFDPRTHRRVGRREIWEKRHPERDITLCQEVEDVDFQRYGGPYRETFWFETNGDLNPLDGVTWADWDTANRVVFARQGCLFACSPDRGAGDIQLLHDLNSGGPRRLATPDWATRW